MKPPRLRVLTAIPLGIGVAWFVLRSSGSSPPNNRAAPDSKSGDAGKIAGGSARSARPSPTVASPRTGDTRSLPATDPRAADYTAAALYEITGRNLQEVYADEPRVEPWASMRERGMLEYTIEDLESLDPQVKVELDCRTSSCRIRVYSSNPFLVDEMGDYPFACMGRYSTGDLGMVDPGPPERKYADYYVLFGDQNLDEESFAQNRDRTCPKYRESWQQHVLKPFNADD